jgi:hypothetical protein
VKYAVTIKFNIFCSKLELNYHNRELQLRMIVHSLVLSLSTKQKIFAHHMSQFDRRRKRDRFNRGTVRLVNFRPMPGSRKVLYKRS